MSKALRLSLALTALAVAEAQDADDKDGASSQEAAAATFAAQRTMFMNVRTAHAAVLAISFVFLYPLGAFLMRLMHHRSTLAAHVATQVTALALSIAGMGMGIWMATHDPESLLGHHHAIIGMVVISLLVLQPLGGILAHRVFKSSGPNVVGFGHAWFGRALLVLGAINGAFGLQLADNSYPGLVAYAVLMSIVIFSYLVVVFVTDGYKVGGKARLGGSKASPTSSTAREEKGMERHA